MSELCTDGRFEVIAKAKEALLKRTNIDTSPKEMEVLDNFLFRCWQMGWLDKYDKNKNTKILFICDKRACPGICDECEHTTDPAHAINFQQISDGVYIEYTSDFSV